MTKNNNPFVAFWKKWDTILGKGNANVEMQTMNILWDEFKKDFFVLCEKQAKKAEGKRWEYETAFNFGKADAFRLVQGTAQIEKNNKENAILQGKDNRAKAR